MRYILVFIRLAFIAITMCAMYGAYLMSTIFVRHTKERGFRLRRNWARIGNSILGIKNELTGQQYEKPILYVVNHRSLVDPLIIAPHIDAYIVAKAEVASYPVLGPAAQKTGIVFVKREEKASRSATIIKIEEILGRGDNVMIYPEGTTNLYELTKKYHVGSFDVAAKLDIPVVPVVLEYRDHKDLWNIHNMIPQFAKQFGVWNTYTKMHIGPKMSSKDGFALMQKAKDYTDNKLIEMHKNWNNMQFDEVPQEA